LEVADVAPWPVGFSVIFGICVAEVVVRGVYGEIWEGWLRIERLRILKKAINSAIALHQVRHSLPFSALIHL